jgi:hypothetical protein
MVIEQCKPKRMTASHIELRDSESRVPIHRQIGKKFFYQLALIIDLKTGR